MKRFVTITALAVTAAMLAPSALAWYGYGSHEPNNAYDASGSYMFTDGPGGATNRVYFNVVTGIGGPLGYPGVSPNSATVGSRVESPAGGFEAVLGVWADCNHDGYIGMADGALREYRVEVANLDSAHKVDTTICPSIPDTPGNQGRIHNSNGWVTELIPIGASSQNHGAINTDHRTIYDGLAKVWGDNLEPKTLNTPAQTGTCSILFGSGQSRHTGGILTHVDCADGGAPDAARDRVVSLDPADLGAAPTPSTLWATNGPADKALPAQVAGDESSSNSFVSGEQDCSKDPIVDTTAQVKQPNQPWGKSGIRPPGTPHANANGNVAGTVNETREESAADDCNGGNDFGHDWYGNFETTNAGSVNNAHKTYAEFNFLFRQWNNRQGTANGGCGTGATGALCGLPADGGVPEVYVWEGTGSNMWTSTVVLNSGPTVGGTTVDLATKSADPSYFPGDWYTFYASLTVTSVGSDALATPGSGTYGDVFCDQGIGRNSGFQHGWDCDPANWNLDPNTGGKVLGEQYLGTVGDAFQLRDADCYDTTVVEGAANPTGSDVGGHTVPVVTKGETRCA